MFVGGVVVEDNVNHLASRHLGLYGIQETNELLMTMAPHVGTDGRVVENVQRGEQGRGAVALVIVRHGAEPTFFSGSPGWARSRACIL
jgi:hypothetical protein